MKFTRIEIDDYGPLQGWSLADPVNFNLIFGNNEAGKTLAIEAIWKMLWSRHAKKLQGADRVDENPRGFLRLDFQGKDFRFPDLGNLDTLIDLTPELCRNTFIVRNSDLEIPREGDYFSQVTSRLTGLKTSEIEKIEKAILDLSSLTGTLKFKDDASSNKLKTRLDIAWETNGDIEKLLERIEEEGWDKLEQELVWNYEKAQLLETDLKKLNLARRRKMYEEGKTTYNELKTVSENLVELQKFSQKEAEKWRDLNGEEKRKRDHLKKLQEEEKKLEEKLEEIETELEGIGSETNSLKKAKTAIDEEIIPELKEMEQREEKFNKRKKAERFYKVTGTVSLGFIILSLLVPLFSPELWVNSLLIGGFFLLAGFFTGFQIYRLRREEGEIEEIFTRIKNRLQRFNIEGEKKELVVGMEKIQQDYEGLESKKDQINHEKTYAQRRKEEIVVEKGQVEEKIEAIDGEINELKRKNETETLEEYLQKLEIKASLEKKKTSLGYNLQRVFQISGEVEDWGRIIKEYEAYKGEASDYDFSPEIVEKKEKEIAELKKSREEKEEQLEEFKRELGEIERRINKEIFPEEEYIPCNTSLDLREGKKKLKEFVDFHEENRERARVVLEIFSGIKGEEEEKVSSIFADSRVDEIFSQITEGRYREVSYDRETGKILVREETGKALPAEKLSGGAFDQLYLAIRVAMGEKILGDNKGFFILDDPFIKADQVRLQRLIQTVKDLTIRGWQVLYFSCKKEIREILEPEIQGKEVKLIEI